MRVLIVGRRSGCGCESQDLALVDGKRRSLLCVRHWHPLLMAEAAERPAVAVRLVFERALPQMPPALLSGPRAEVRLADVVDRQYGWLSGAAPGSLVEVHGRFLWYRTASGSGGSLPIP